MYLEDVACGLQFGFLLLLHGGSGDRVLHTDLGSRLGKVLIQLNLQVERSKQFVALKTRKVPAFHQLYHLWKIATKLLPTWRYIRFMTAHLQRTALIFLGLQLTDLLQSYF